MPDSPQTAPPWLQNKVLASDGSAFAWFGSGMAISGSTALVSARNAKISGQPSQGAVYVFMRSAAGAWKQGQKLVGAGGGAGDQFGATLALHGDIAFVAAPNATVRGNIWQGRVHVFVHRNRGQPAWVEVQALTASDGAAFDTLGTSVEFTDEYAFVGAGGATNGAGQRKPRKVYVFRRAARSVTHWEQAQVLENPDPADPNNSFGASLAASKDILLVGARSATLGDNIGQGVVYSYRLHGGLWLPDGKFSDASGAARDNFGASIALQDCTLLIGAPGAVTQGNQGVVYRYDLKAGTWHEVQRLTPLQGVSPSLFGAALGMSGESALVGAYAEDGYRGAAYVFTIKTGRYSQSQRLTAVDAVANDVFGHYVALEGTTAIVGAYPKKNGANVQEGATYFHVRPSLGSGSG